MQMDFHLMLHLRSFLSFTHFLPGLLICWYHGFLPSNNYTSGSDALNGMFLKQYLEYFINIFLWSIKWNNSIKSFSPILDLYTHTVYCKTLHTVCCLHCYSSKIQGPPTWHTNKNLCFYHGLRAVAPTTQLHDAAGECSVFWETLNRYTMLLMTECLGNAPLGSCMLFTTLPL